MGFFIGLLTVAMVLDCLFLILLVLMQLPKKDAGAGLAFGGTATDALFGAGSGNFLTKATKYTAGVFFALVIALSVLQNHYAHRKGSEFEQLLQQPAAITPLPPPAKPAAPVAPPAAPGMGAATNSLLIPVPVTGNTNAAKP